MRANHKKSLKEHSREMFYINGFFLDEDKAKVSVLDLGLLRGYGVFDYLRTYKKHPFHLWDHVERLRYSAKEIDLALPDDFEKIESILETLLENAVSESSIKIIITGGISSDHLMPTDKTSLIIFIYPLKLLPDQSYLKGINAITTSLNRTIPKSKTLQYIPAIMALQQGRSKNAQEALYLNQKKQILEATTSNFFAFKNNVLMTSDSDEILFGITREILMRLATPYFKIESRSIEYDGLRELDEAFLTSSNKEILPVTKIDDIVIGKGNVGEKTKFLMGLFSEYTKLNYWPYLKIKRHALTQ
jgi:branched-chain amino acid aminotransferase